MHPAAPKAISGMNIPSAPPQSPPSGPETATAPPAIRTAAATRTVPHPIRRPLKRRHPSHMQPVVATKAALPTAIAHQASGVCAHRA